MASVEDLLARVVKRFDKTVTCKIQTEQLIIEVAPGDLLKVCKALRDGSDFKFEQLIDVCGVDYLDYGLSEWATDTATREGYSRGVESNAYKADEVDNVPERFAVVYQLLSVTHNHRVRIRSFAAGEPPRMPSVIGLWPSANWYEREAFDLYGIMFEGHPDLRRILTDYGFVGHPFRKDFPLIGEVEMRYDATEGRVVYEPVSIEPRTLVPKVIKHVGHNE